MNDKFNAFNKAKEEAGSTQAPKMPIGLPQKVRETKEQMSITLTPTQKNKLREYANMANMSASELIGYWIENQE